MNGSALPAQWFDGRRAGAQPCTLHWQGDHLLLRDGNGAERRYERQTVQWPERTRHGRRQVLLPDGGVIDLPDAAAWDAWAGAQGLAQPLAARWALSWRMAAGAALGLLLFLFVSWRWLLPWGAEAAAAAVPVTWEQRIGEATLKQLEPLGFKPSQLDADQRAQIEAAVASMVARAYRRDERPQYRLLFRQAPASLGPNALALPGGSIVITDALVTMLPAQDGVPDPALLGVVAHELGHVRERHGLEMLFKATALSTVIGLWLGDFSTVLATVPVWLAQADYSRQAEREADDEALRVMRAAGIDPRHMVRFFQALQKALPERDGDAIAFGLATHPADSERVRFFGGERTGPQGAAP